MKQNWKTGVISSVSAITAAAAFVMAGVGFALPARADTAPAPAAPAAYTIHAGDQLNVQVFGDPSLSQNVTVLPSGSIDYPLVGEVHVAGDTTDQAKAAITKALKKYVRNPVVSVAVQAQGQINVLVVGGVIHPGRVQLPSSAHLTDAISAAGGLDPTTQAYPNAMITDYSGQQQEIPLEPIFHNGDLKGNISVTDGSTIYVPGSHEISVEISGAVDHPGEIELNEGDRLSMAIAKAGNSATADSDLNNVHVTRITPDGKTQNLNINLYDQLQHGNVASDIVMQKGDVVFVPKAKHGINGSGNSSPLYLLVLGLRDLFPHI